VQHTAKGCDENEVAARDRQSSPNRRFHFNRTFALCLFNVIEE
jgi:hypothetical protein